MDRGPRSFLFTRDKAVAAEAGEDYAIRKVPFHWKRPSFGFAVIIFGTTTSVFAFALGGTLALQYGLPTTIIAGLLGCVVGIPLAGVVAWQAANSSMDIDLLSRGAGFGFLGSSITAMIYGSNYLMYAGFEASFMATAIHAAWPLPPLWLIYAVVALAFVALTWYGVSQINWLQLWSTPFFLAGIVWVLTIALGKPTIRAAAVPMATSVLLPALAPVLANVAIYILLIGDYARFIRKTQRRQAIVLTAIFGFASEFLVMVPIGGILALHTNLANPGTYAVALIGIPGLLWILSTQLRVQLGNYYSSSLAMANFSARVLHWVPGRRLFLFVCAAITFLLAEFGILDHLTYILTFMGSFLFAWIGVMIAYLVVTHAETLRSSRGWLEHRRGYLRTWGWPAVGGLAVGSVVGAFLTLSGWPQPYGGFIGIIVAGVLGALVSSVLNRVVGVEYMIKRSPDPDWRDTNDKSDLQLADPKFQVACGTCGTTVMQVDACVCPVTKGGVICSSCCAAHATCHDVCKTPEYATMPEAQIRSLGEASGV